MAITRAWCEDLTPIHYTDLYRRYLIITVRAISTKDKYKTHFYNRKLPILVQLCVHIQQPDAIQTLAAVRALMVWAELMNCKHIT